MNTRIPRSWYLIAGAVVLLAVLIAGCTAPSGPAPVTTLATPLATPPPATSAPTIVVTTTTVAPTLPVTTPPTPTAAPTTPLPPQPVSVAIQNFAFVPPSVTVPTGTMVIWTNQDSAPHTIVSDATPTFSLGAIFMSNQLGMGQTFSYTFNNPGTYLYHCGIHPFMKGTVTVT